MEKQAGKKFIKPAKSYPKYFPDDLKMILALPNNISGMIPINTNWTNVKLKNNKDAFNNSNGNLDRTLGWGDAIEPWNLQALNHHVESVNLSQSAFKPVGNDQIKATRVLSRSLIDLEPFQVQMNDHKEPISINSSSDYFVDKSSSRPNTESKNDKEPEEEDKEPKKDDAFYKEQSISTPTAHIMYWDNSESGKYSEEKKEWIKNGANKSTFLIRPKWTYLLDPQVVMALSDYYRDSHFNSCENEANKIFESLVFHSLVMV